MNTPLLSICIPTYKRPKALIECLNSVLHEKGYSSKLVEIVVSDNDPRSPHKKFPSAVNYWKNAKNLGPENNYLKLISHATGKYVFFLSDDDLLTKNALSTLIRILQTKKNLFVLSSAYDFYKQGKRVKTEQIFAQSRAIDKKDAKACAKLFYNAHTLSGQCILRRAIDIKTCRAYVGTLYLQMYIVGHATLQGDSYYSTIPVVKHEIDNQVYWEYKDDYMIADLLKMIGDLSLMNKNFQQYAQKPIIKNIPYIIYRNLGRPQKLIKFLHFLYNHHVLSRAEMYWWLCEGVYSVVADKVSTVYKETFLPKISSRFVRRK